MRIIITICVVVFFAACTNKKAEIVDQIRLQQNLLDSLKREGAADLANYRQQLNKIDNIKFDVTKDSLPAPDYKKAIELDMKIHAAKRSIDSLTLELKKY